MSWDVTIVTHAGLPGGAEDDRLLARAIRRSGGRPRIVAWDAPADWSASPVTVVRSTWTYFHDLAAWSAWIETADRVTRLRNPRTLLSFNRHKRYLVALGRSGVPVVPTLLIERERDIPADGGFALDDVVVKPAVAAGAFGVRRFPHGHDPWEREAHVRHLLASGGVLIQPYQKTVEQERERSLVFIAGAFSHAFTKPAFDAGGGSGELRLHAAAEDEIAVAERALGALSEAPTYARVDLVPSARGPLLMELELIEPDLALRLHPAAADQLAVHLTATE